MNIVLNLLRPVNFTVLQHTFIVLSFSNNTIATILSNLISQSHPQLYHYLNLHQFTQNIMHAWNLLSLQLKTNVVFSALSQILELQMLCTLMYTGAYDAMIDDEILWLVDRYCVINVDELKSHLMVFYVINQKSQNVLAYITF